MANSSPATCEAVERLLKVNNGPKGPGRIRTSARGVPHLVFDAPPITERDPNSLLYQPASASVCWFGAPSRRYFKVFWPWPGNTDSVRALSTREVRVILRQLGVWIPEP